MKKAIIIILAVLVITPFALYFAFPEVLVDLSTLMQRKSVGLEKKIVKIQDHDIFYLEGGKGDTIVLLHGYTANKDAWLQFAEFLIPKYHLVIPDVPGFGESTKIPETAYTIAFQAEMLDKFVSALGLSKFHLAGNSMGGMISGFYSANYPTKVMSLGLFNTGGVMSCEKSELFKLLEKGENPILFETVEQQDRIIRLVFAQPPAMPKQFKKVMLKRAIEDKPFNEKIFNDFFVEEPYLLEKDLPKISVNTLILWGDKDGLVDVSCVKPLEQGLKNSTTVVMENCGHAPMIERPEEAANHYLSFIVK